MILIADSGSTKTSWRFINAAKEIQQARTEGFNPYFETPQEMADKLRKGLLPQLDSSEKVSEIYFYGAGCGNTLQNQTVTTALQSCFAEAKIYVENDMLGAARGLGGNEASIICILGTGSNSCFYDGQAIKGNLGGLGLLLGDEGGGAYMGRKLIKDYLDNAMPKSLHEKLEKRYKLNKVEILENVYSKPYPNRYLASFAKFLFDNKEQAYCSLLVYHSFLDFFKNTVMKYPNYQDYKVHFTGSIAFYFSSLLHKVAADNEIKLGNIAEEPIAGLSLYHLDKQ